MTTTEPAPSEQTDPTLEWHKNVCILCSNNCGVEIRVDGREITPVSYTHLTLPTNREV